MTRTRIVLALLLCGLATPARAQPSGAAAVPPLAVGESPPAEAPNYFDARELGAATLRVLVDCGRTLQQARPDAPAAMQRALCECYADAERWHTRGGARSPATPQFDVCVDSTAHEAPSPFADKFTVKTAAIVRAFNACAQALGEGVDPAYRNFACGCATDAWLADDDDRQFDRDLARCDAAGRYRAATGRNPTLRQFKSIRSEAPSARRPAPTAIEPARPVTGPFIPYHGNGGGPTLCADGMHSHSSGRGTCSHHGGIAGGRHRRR